MTKKLFIGAYILLGMIILGLCGYLILILIGNHYTNKDNLVLDATTRIEDQQGHEISKLYLENRETVSINKIPKFVQEAFIATEDSRFYQHSGIDFRGTARALTRDIFTGSKAEGGSTITQQLSKNVFLTNQKSWFRKIKEAAIATNLERKYSKKQILGMYLNQIYFGHGVYGIQSASKFFFNKDVSQLTVEEGAMLAAIPKAPTTYSPILHPHQALSRRNIVLGLMENQGYITAEEEVHLKGKTLGLDVHQLNKDPEYDTYVDMVLDEAARKYHLSADEVLRGGYKIIVPINIKIQAASYQEFKKNQYFKGSNTKEKPNGAFVLIDNKTGGVEAVQGGRSYVKKSFNRVNVKRQPGSAFKPLAVYGPALETKKFHPYSMLVDKQMTFKKFDNYAPENYNHKYPGEITMYDALTVSENVPAVWLLNEIGIPKSKQYLSKLGFNIPDKGLSMALGGLKEGVTPFQMATAYTAFSNGGKEVEPYFIQEIVDHKGNLVGSMKPKTRQVFSKQTAWYMTKMLISVVQNGTGSAGSVNTELAGKTGSTAYEGVDNGLRDAWFVGFTPKSTGAVWIGYDKTTKEQYVTGGSEDATTLFKNIINNVPSETGNHFVKPKGIKDLEPPIRLAPIKNITAKGTVGHFGLPAVKISWDKIQDKRIIYRIYKENENRVEFVGEVKGKNSFVVNYANPLSSATYFVTPYNSQTLKKGETSKKVEVNWFPGF
ncbi:transglycosylase domain-containing protein [Terrilactibacillus laevilacticus]|uniref:Transglycosylase domain-containing protein n=1 Tax=Terrilactibacillus laevilacticus TaxID=1380157 RepID=A0ABW5PQU2_9BACI|nr:PBP1A family penicillin-binding protein [Terrilactibacillus laevilacticus]